MIISRVGCLVGHLHIYHLINRIQLYGTSRSRRRPKLISFRLITPPSQEAQGMTFDSASVLEKYIGKGTLRTLDSAGKLRVISPDKYKDILPSESYSITMPHSMPARSLENYIRTYF